MAISGTTTMPRSEAKATISAYCSCVYQPPGPPPTAVSPPTVASLGHDSISIRQPWSSVRWRWRRLRPSAAMASTNRLTSSGKKKCRATASTAPRRAVDQRRRLEHAGDRHDEAAQRPHAERQRDRQVRDDHAGERVHEVVAREHHVQRDDQPRRRQHLDPDHEHDEQLAPGEAVLRECDRSEEGEHDRDRDRHEHDHNAVLDILPEVRSMDRLGEVRERRVRREPRRRKADDLVVRLERGRDHPEDRKHHHDEDGDAEHVPAAATKRATVHSTSPSCTILRTYTTLIAATISSIRIEIAAPRPKSLLKYPSSKR